MRPDQEARADAAERRRQAARRAALDRASFDPAPPGDDDWTIEEPGTDGLRRVPDPRPIGEALAELVQRQGWSQRLAASTLWARWEEVVGPELVRHCQPVRLAGGILVVRASSAVWATQLRYVVPGLLANLAEVLGEPLVEEVRLVVGPLQSG